MLAQYGQAGLEAANDLLSKVWNMYGTNKLQNPSAFLHKSASNARLTLKAQYTKEQKHAREQDKM